MHKLLYGLLAGLLLTGAAGGARPIASGERALSNSAVLPTGPSKPASPPPYTLYLPVTLQRYMAGPFAPFGVDMYGGNSPSDGQAQMQAAGAGWEAAVFDWSVVEPNAPIGSVHQYNWSGFDQIAQQAQDSGMNLFVLFTNNPAWAAPLAGGAVYTDHVADLNSVVAAAAERYDGDGVDDAPGSPVINYWSFYAEPDNSDPTRAAQGKGLWGNNPNGYGDMIAGVASAMHAANPNAVVMIGGLAYDFFTTDTPHGPFVQTFLAGVLNRLNTNWGGAANTLGAMAFHYYPINTTRWPTIKEKTAEIRSILTANGVGNLPIIVPEMGYWSDSKVGSSEAQQASMLVQMFTRGLSVGIKEMSWFEVFDSGPGTETHGLFRGTNLNSPKPAYSAYTTLAAELRGTKYLSALSGNGLEGYVFDLGGGQQKTVVWAVPPATSALVVFHQTCLRRVDDLGNVTTPIYDGNSFWDKDHVAGQISLQVQPNQPIYVGGC